VAARANLAVTPPADTVDDEEDDDDIDFLTDDEEGEGVSVEQQALVALFESLPLDARQA
jgi:hypothetical protein